MVVLVFFLIAVLLMIYVVPQMCNTVLQLCNRIVISLAKNEKGSSTRDVATYLTVHSLSPLIVSSQNNSHRLHTNFFLSLLAVDHTITQGVELFARFSNSLHHIVINDEMASQKQG